MPEEFLPTHSNSSSHPGVIRPPSGIPVESEDDADLYEHIDPVIRARELRRMRHTF